MNQITINQIANWRSTFNPLDHVLGKDDVCRCLLANNERIFHSGMILLSDRIDHEMNARQKFMRILIKQATKGEYVECQAGGIADLGYPHSETRRGRVQGGGGISPAVTSEALTSYRMEVDAMEQLRIRRLTPRECWRLMDFSDEDFDKAKAVNSDTQLYKQAGNSIVVNVLVAIFGQMFDGKENEYKNGK